MNAHVTVPCSTCGVELPRSAMFGLEPELQCPPCAQGIRERTIVRQRVVIKPRNPVVTIIFLVACTVIFLAAMRFQSKDALPTWFALLMQDLEIWKGEVWRHFTCTIVHTQWWHWLMNGMALWSLGRWFETAYGSLAMLGTVVVTGVAGATLAWIFQVGPSVGISGAIFGLCGVFWAQRPHNALAAAIMTDRLRNWVLMFLVLGIVLSGTGGVRVSNWGHGGGLAAGLLLGWAAAQPMRKLLLAGSVLLVGAIVVASIYISLGTSQWVNTRTKEPVPGAELRKLYLAGELPERD